MVALREGSRIQYDPAAVIPHPDGDKRVSDYPPEVVELLHQMNTLAKRLQKRRLHDGQIVLDLPEVDLVLDEEGKVVDAVPEDQSFTHTLIEMFMVEANEAVARLLDSLGVPFLRRTHPDPEPDSAERLRQFLQVAGVKLPKRMDRKSLQALLQSVKGRPESFAINLAVLKSLTRAEYSPEKIGHYALASENYCHFTSPIRRYADLTVHRLLDAYFEARGLAGGGGGKKRRKVVVDLEEVPSYDDLVEVGRHISFTERRADGAEKELRQVKILELLQQHIGDEFLGVVTGITNFGIFVQIQTYLIEGLIRYENLMDDWWDVDARGGYIRGQRTGKRIGIGDVVTVRIARIELARRELDLAVTEVKGRKGSHEELTVPDAERERADPGQRRDDGGARPPKKKHHPKAKSGKQPNPRSQHPLRGGGPRQKRHTPGRRRR
jgi:ribonuclease R